MSLCVEGQWKALICTGAHSLEQGCRVRSSDWQYGDVLVCWAALEGV